MNDPETLKYFPASFLLTFPSFFSLSFTPLYLQSFYCSSFFLWFQKMFPVNKILKKKILASILL